MQMLLSTVASERTEEREDEMEMLASWVLAGRYKRKRTQLRSMLNILSCDPKACSLWEELVNEEGGNEVDMIEDNVKRGENP